MSGATNIFMASGKAPALSLNDNYVEFSQATGPVTCTYYVGSNGFTSVDVWLTPASFASAYDVKCTLLSGTLSAGTTGSFQNLATSRSWSCRSNLGTGGVTIFLELAATGTTTPILDSATIDMVAFVDGGSGGGSGGGGGEVP